MQVVFQVQFNSGTIFVGICQQKVMYQKDQLYVFLGLQLEIIYI